MHSKVVRFLDSLMDYSGMKNSFEKIIKKIKKQDSSDSSDSNMHNITLTLLVGKL